MFFVFAFCFGVIVTEQYSETPSVDAHGDAVMPPAVDAHEGAVMPQ